jgi:NADPH:quinone reductase-like Zn-dependent oxidoreductase
MKAAYYERYGSADVLEIKEIARPEIKDNEVLVKVYATSVSTADWRIRASAFPAFSWLPGRLMFGLFRPKAKVPGADFAGRVVAKGKAVTRFNGGDAVFGTKRPGAHAEYLAVAEDGVIAAKPACLDYAEAAAVPFGALSALVFLRDFAKVRPGQKVLINGASGGVGVYAVQLAKHFGAEVTAVCSAGNQRLVAALGADHVIDYTTEDFTRSGKTYDLIVDTVGKTTFAACRRALTGTGIFLPIEFGLCDVVQSLISRIARGKRVVVGISNESRKDLALIADLLERRAIRPVIDGFYPLDRIADAHRRVESRHKTGSVIVTLPDTPQAA